MDLQTLYRKLAQYKNLKNDIYSILNHLKKTTNPLKEASEIIKKSYLINDSGADNGDVLLEYNRVKSVINTLECVILPSINANINSINNSITDLEAAQMIAPL